MVIDNKSDSTTDSDLDSLFDSSDNKADVASNTDLESLLEEVDSNIDDDNNLFDDKVRYPPKYYLAVLANLDVGRLRQKRYSLRRKTGLTRLRTIISGISQYRLTLLRKSTNVALLLDTTPSSDKTPPSAFKKSQPAFSTASCAGSATNDKGKGDGGGLELSI